MKKLLIFIGIIFATLLTAWLTFPYYAKGLINGILADQAVVIETLDISNHGLGSLEIDKLKLRLTLPQGQSLQIDAEALTSQHDLLPFFIADLSVATLTITLGSETIQTSVPRSTIDSHALPPRNASARRAGFQLAKLPFNDINIERLQLQHASGFAFPIATSLNIKRENTNLAILLKDKMHAKNRLDLRFEQPKKQISTNFELDWDFSPHFFTLKFLLQKVSPQIQLQQDFPLAISISGRSELQRNWQATGTWSLSHPSVSGQTALNQPWLLNKTQISGRFEKDSKTVVITLNDGQLLNAMLDKSLLGLADEATEKQTAVREKQPLIISSNNFSLNYSAGLGQSTGSITQRLPNLFDNKIENIHWQKGESITFESTGYGAIATLKPGLSGAAKFHLFPRFSPRKDGLEFDFYKTGNIQLEDFAVNREAQRLSSELITIELTPKIFTKRASPAVSSEGEYRIAIKSPYYFNKQSETEQSIGQRLPELTMSGSWEQQAAIIQIKNSLQFDDTNTFISTPSTLDLAKREVKGRMDINPDNNFIEQVNLEDYIPEFSDTIKSKSGKILLGGDFKAAMGEDPFRYTLTGTGGISEVDVILEASQVKGIDLPLQINLSEKAKSITGILKVEQFKAKEKLEFSQFTSHLSLIDQKLNVSKTTFQGAGTNFFIDDFSSPLQPLAFSSKIHFAKTPMQEWVKVANLESLNVVGTLSGDLPISYQDGQLLVDDGLLKADKQGLIKYRPEGQLDTICLDLKNITNLQKYALQNFFYEQLQMQVNYDGKLALNLPLVLKGSNPNFCEGREIVLNLNLNYEIPENLWVYFLFGDDFLKKWQAAH